VKMRKTLSEDSSTVDNLFHDCANNYFENETKVDEDGSSVTIIGQEDSSAHTTDGGDSRNIIHVRGHAKSESSNDKGRSITVPGKKSLSGWGGSLEIIIGQSGTTFSGENCDLRSVEISTGMGSQQNSRREENVAVSMSDGEPDVATLSLPECEHGQDTIPPHDNQIVPPAYDNCPKNEYNDEAEVDEYDINNKDREDYSEK
jgi:hypothetical protein